MGEQERDAKIEMNSYRIEQLEQTVTTWKRGVVGLLVLAVGALISFVFKLLEK